MKKKILSVLVIVAMIISVIPANIILAVSAESTAVLTVEEPWANPGGTVDVNLIITENPGILGASFTVSWDDSLTLIDDASGEVFSHMTYTSPSRYTSSGTNFVWFGNEVDEAVNGVALTLTFRVSETEENNDILPVWVTYTHGDVIDCNDKDVALNITDGHVRVITYKPGDVTGDNRVNSRDLVRLSQYISDSCTTDPEGYNAEVVADACDVTGDGRVNARDLIRLSQYISDGCQTSPDGYNAVLNPAKLPVCEHTNPVKTAYKAPSCVGTGIRENWYCSDCYKYFADDECSNEIAYADTIIEATGHTEVTDEPVAPDYDNTGLTEGSHCSVCNEVLKAQETVPTLKPTYHSITYKNLKTADVSVEYTQYAEHIGFDLPENITVDGYRFDGWYTEPEGGTKVVYIPKGSTAEYILYAHWSLIPYTITYYDAPKNSNPATYTVEDEVILSDPEWSGLRFTGWTVGSPDNKNRTDISKIKIGTTGNIELTAEWKQERNIAIPQTNSHPLLTEIDISGGRYYFIYELGTIQNVVLDEIKSNDSGTTYDLYNKTTDANRTLTISQSISINESRANDIAKTVSNSVTQTDDWSTTHSWATSRSDTRNWNVSGELEIGTDSWPVRGKIGTSGGHSWTTESSTGNATAKGGSISVGGEESETISSTVEFSTVLGKEKEVSVEISGEMPNGFYAYVHAGNIKVYAVVIYDIVNGNYTVTTYNILDNTYELLLYARDAGELNSQDCEALSYNIPHDEIQTLAESAYYIDYHLMTQDTTLAEQVDVYNPNSNGFNYTGTETLSFKDPTRGKYDIFLGWYADPSFTTRVDEAWIENWYQNPRNITLYAKWDLAIYYDTLGGTPQLSAIGERKRVVVDWSGYSAGVHNYPNAIDGDGDGKRDASGNILNTNIDINSPITEVYFIGNTSATFTGVHIIPCAYASAKELVIHFEDFRFNGSVWPYADEGVSLTVDCAGTNRIDGQIYDFVNISFVGNGILNIYGNDGGNGASGSDATASGGEGGAGTAGANGSSAIVADSVTVKMNGTFNVYGGDGGNGGNGGKGAMGSAGARYDIWFSKAYNGGTGGSGGKGGTGGRGGYAIECDSITIISGTCNFFGGDSGSGGTGGAGGTGGKGGNSNAWGTEGGDGGMGGIGGVGGNAYYGISALNVQATILTDADVKVYDGQNGSVGTGGSGGSGGTPGCYDGGGSDSGQVRFGAYGSDGAAGNSGSLI